MRREILYNLTDHLDVNDANINIIGQKVILLSFYYAGDRAI
jgi:hypothetical protein